MKCIVSIACVLLSVFVAASYAAPAGAGFSASASLQAGGSGGSGTDVTASTGANGGISNILSNIDLPGLLRGVNSFVKLVEVFCPPLSQVLDNVIQNVTSTAFRVFGRIILQGGGFGGSTSNSGGSGGASKVDVVLPTFPPDEDYDDEDEDDKNDNKTEASLDAIDLRIAPKATTTESTTTTTTTSITTTSTTDSASPAIEENTVAKRHVRVVREADQATAEEQEETDQDGAESAPQPSQDLSNVEDDADRNKRYSPFGGGDGHGGAGGGSGNFLFDIIRLVAGSGATEESDEKANAPGGVAEIDIAPKGHDGYTEGIPGPITRLFVLANRGIANLVQDLILRLAQTSERIVNFKARLVTSLI